MVSDSLVFAHHPGGIAGGEKFIVQSILFKYALDTDVMPGLWMYGGDFPDDASAMKAAGARRTSPSGRARAVVADGFSPPPTQGTSFARWRGWRIRAR
jgi:hypothetical protein